MTYYWQTTAWPIPVQRVGPQS